MWKSQVELCLAIAEEHLEESDRLLKEGQKPIPGVGVVVTLDEDQRSYRASLIAIAFACAAIEGLLWVHLVARFPADAEALDRLVYEERAKRLGISDASLLAALERLRDVRKAVLHAKPGSLDQATMYFGQNEAPIAVGIAKDLQAALPVEPARTAPPGAL